VLLPSTGRIALTSSFPTVSVPVLSRSREETLPRDSRAAPPRIRIPCRRATLLATSTATGTTLASKKKEPLNGMITSDELAGIATIAVIVGVVLAVVKKRRRGPEIELPPPPPT